ncbi:hypothetical protein Tco_1192136 [Tanacetum coccineum]
MLIADEPLLSSSHPPIISATTESEPTHVAEPTPHPKLPSTEPNSEPFEQTFEQPSPEHQPLSPRQETGVPQSQDPAHPHVAEERTMSVDDLLQLVPKLLTKGRNLQEEGLDEMIRNMMKDKLEVFKTPTQSKTSGEEDISPITLEAAKTLSKVASQKSKSVDKEVNTGGLGVSTGSGPVSSARGQREGKAPMIVEETQAPKRTKEQIQQEEASLAEAIRLQTLEEEETAKQVHLDALLAKRMEEEELTKQQKQRKAQVQFEAQHYTEEDWDAIRAKLEANAELTKNVLGKELPEEDFAKKMVELVNQRKKFFAEERAKARRSKPMTQSLLRNYMMNYLKNQGTWKLTQLKKLSFKEVKEEFDKLVKQVESFVPINIEATKAQLKRYGEELQTKISKKQRIDVSRYRKKYGKSKVGRASKKKTDKEESVEAMNPTPLDTKSNIVANWKIFQQGERSIYQIIRANGADTIYMSFGAMLKDFTREDLIELTMFDPPLNEDAILSLPLQQKMISWRYYDKCAVHCLTFEAFSIYMLADRKYPLSKDACQVMLKMKLLNGKMNEVCYKLLKMIEKQAGFKNNSKDNAYNILRKLIMKNGNSKKRISTGKDGVVRILSPVSAAEIHVFEAFTISSSEGLEKGYDRFQQLLSQLEVHCAEVSTKDANHKFLRSLPPAWLNLAMTMRNKPDVDTLSIDDLYNNLRVFEQELTSTSKSSASAQNVSFVSHSKSSTNKVKSGHTGAYSTYTPSTSSNNIPEREVPAGFSDEVIYSLFSKQSEDLDLLHEDLEQIDDMDIEEMDINWQITMIAIQMKKFYKKTRRRVRIDEEVDWVFY